MSALDGSDDGAAADYHNENRSSDFTFLKLPGRTADLLSRNTARPKRLGTCGAKLCAREINCSRKARRGSHSIGITGFDAKNPQRSPPLKVSDCSQITDGRRRSFLFPTYLTKSNDKQTVRLFGYGHTTDYLPLDKKDAPTFSARKAAEKVSNGEPEAARFHGRRSRLFFHQKLSPRNSRPGRTGQRRRPCEKRATTLPRVRKPRRRSKFQ
jgi:hypothetical protein